MEEWRTFLYPLGFIASLIFGARFLLQWIQSEEAGRSCVNRSFWHLSLAGNCLLALHSFIQIQYPICLAQVCNGLIAWRNLNLMTPRSNQSSFQAVLWGFAALISGVTLAFFLQDFLLNPPQAWFRTPVPPWQSSRSISHSLLWHTLGTIGYLLFSSRFWVQWWISEKSGESRLSASFWWISLFGALLSILYFVKIEDSVNLIGPLIGLPPYVRNLILIYRHPKQEIPE